MSTIKKTSTKKISKKSLSRTKKAAKKRPLKKSVSIKAKTKSNAQLLGTSLSDVDCICRQKRPKGKFFCFQLIEGGRLVQSSGIGFRTKEECEAVFCVD